MPPKTYAGRRRRAEKQEQQQQPPPPKKGTVVKSQPEKVMHPHSAFALFAKETRPLIVAAFPGEKAQLITRRVAAEWKEASDDMREEYNLRAANDVVRNNRESAGPEKKRKAAEREIVHQRKNKNQRNPPKKQKTTQPNGAAAFVSAKIDAKSVKLRESRPRAAKAARTARQTEPKEIARNDIEPRRSTRVASSQNKAKKKKAGKAVKAVLLPTSAKGRSRRDTGAKLFWRDPATERFKRLQEDARNQPSAIAVRERILAAKDVEELPTIEGSRDTPWGEEFYCAFNRGQTNELGAWISDVDLRCNPLMEERGQSFRRIVAVNLIARQQATVVPGSEEIAETQASFGLHKSPTVLERKPGVKKRSASVRDALRVLSSIRFPAPNLN